jgi:FkbM family methyltransferase
MLLGLDDLIEKFNLRIKGVLHIGAHLAEEASLYHSLGINNVWWVEGNPDLIKRVEEIASHYDDNHVLQGLVADEEKDVVFHITNYDSMSSSIFDFGTHTQFSPDTVMLEHRPMRTITLDSHINKFQGINFLNMDIQGAELLALKGAEKLIPQLDYIYCEVNNQQVYEGCAQIGDLDAFLQDRGFLRVETSWVPRQGWGDALYVRKELC